MNNTLNKLRTMTKTKCFRARYQSAALILLVPVTVTLGGCRKDSDARAEGVVRADVTLGTENITIAETTRLSSGPAISGSLTAEREATVRAEVSGPVLQTYVEKGQAVQRGALIARIDDSSIREQYLSAKSAVTAARNGADIARRDAERAARLTEAGAIATRDLDVAQQSRIAAEAQLEDARARFAFAERQLANTQVRAPFAGLVSDRPVSGGDIVQPGAALFTIVDPASMKLEASVPAEKLASLRVGAPVEFTVRGYPGRAFVGRIERINPAADPITRQVLIYIAIPNSGGRLVTGLFAEGRVATESRTAVTVPVSAVDLRGVRPSVMRVRDGRVEKIEVDVGLRDDASERLEIRAGLASGDTLLLGAAQGITVGTEVLVNRDSGFRDSGLRIRDSDAPGVPRVPNP